jgi:glutamine amidotransferase
MDKSHRIGVVDYGTGNLRSVVKAFEFLGSKVSILREPERAQDMDALVFPGQGTFDQCMEALNASGFDELIKGWIEQDRPYFGICLGLQVLFDKSEEGSLPGLGVFRGEVKRFSLDSSFKIPHMGWNGVRWNLSKDDPVRKNLEDGDQFYFVHSYHVVEAEDGLDTFSTTYGSSFTSGLLSSHCIATQFHPEKSQAKGLQLYRNFLEKLCKT